VLNNGYPKDREKQLSKWLWLCAYWVPDCLKNERLAKGAAGISLKCVMKKGVIHKDSG
jgi:hypothetical protein